MSDPISVLHILRFDAFGGTETQTAALVTNMPPDRSRQSVVFLDPPGPVSAHIRAAGRHATNVPGRFAFRALLRSVRRVAPDVIEAYGIRAAVLARIVAPFCGNPPVVVGVRGRFFTDAQPGDRKWRLALFVERVLAWRTARYVTNSFGTAERLVGLGFASKKVTAIPNGIDVERFGPASSPRGEALRVTCVARLIPTKRHDVLIRALAELSNRGCEFRCRLAGDGRLRDELNQLARELGVSDRVEFLGEVTRDDLPTLLADSDVFVLCSRAEGLPGSVIEAMAASLPVVGSAVNGIAEVVDDTVTGFVFPRGDHHALADHLERLAREPNLRTRLGGAGRTRAEENYSMARLIEDRALMYEQVARRSL